MLARLRKTEGEGGFTLIELLVVMIIIGILAAIAIPVFLSQRTKAQDSAAKADVSTVGKELAAYYVDNTGAAPTISITGTGDARRYVSGVAPGPVVELGKVSNNVAVINQKGTTDKNWCFAVSNVEGAQKYWQYSAVGGLEKSVVGGCP